MLDILVWSASFGIPLSYIIQIVSNYKHRETRDINIYGVMFADFAYLIYGIKSGMIGESAFMVKYGLSFFFCSVMLAQIIKYRKQNYHWHDDIDKYCSGYVNGSVCCYELEPHWEYCPKCGSEVL